MIVVNPNNRLRTPLAGIEPPLWAGLTAYYRDADILDAEALDLTLDQTESEIRNIGDRNVMIVVMGNNPSVSSTPKILVAEALADRISDLNVLMTGLHPTAVGSKYPVVKTPFKGFPMMPWDKLPMDRYKAHNWHCLDGSPRSPYASVYTSLGCPFSCYYCNIHTLYGGRKIQFRPVEDVFYEINTLVSKYNVRNIKLWDELFTLREDRVLSICSGLKDYDLNIWAYARLDSVSEKMLKAMKKAGINWLAYGFESVHDPKFIGKTEDIIKMTRDAGINIIANFMFGLPGTMLDDDKASLEFAKKHLFEYVNFYTAKPYPGSQWYSDTHPDMKWEDYNQYGNNRLAFRDIAFNKYFTNGEYLTMVGGKFGQGAVKQLETMVKGG